MMPLARTLQRKAHFKGEWGRVSTSNLRQERMAVSSSVRVMDATLERNGSILLGGWESTAVPPMRRRRSEMHSAMASEDVARVPAVSREGIRLSTAVKVMAGLCFALCIAFLFNLSGMAATSKSVSELRSDIIKTKNASAEIELQIAARDAELDIPRLAREYGMVSQKSVPVIVLHAPETRTEEAETNTEAAPAHSEFFATLLGQ